MAFTTQKITVAELIIFMLRIGLLNGTTQNEIADFPCTYFKATQ